MNTPNADTPTSDTPRRGRRGRIWARVTENYLAWLLLMAGTAAAGPFSLPSPAGGLDRRRSDRDSGAVRGMLVLLSRRCTPGCRRTTHCPVPPRQPGRGDRHRHQHRRTPAPPGLTGRRQQHDPPYLSTVRGSGAFSRCVATDSAALINRWRAAAGACALRAEGCGAAITGRRRVGADAVMTRM